MLNSYEQGQPAHTIEAPHPQSRRSIWKNPLMVGCFLLIAILVLSSALLFWFVVRPFYATYLTPGNGYVPTAVTFAPDGHTLAIAEIWQPPVINDQTPHKVHIDLWNANSGVKLRTLAGSDPIAFSPDGRTLASASQDGHAILLWNASSGTLLHTFVTHNHISSLVFSPDGQTLASSAQDDRATTLWDATHGTILHTLSGHSSGIVSLVYSPDGSQLASGYVDGTIQLWDEASGKVLHTLLKSGDYGRNPVQFSPDGHTLVSVVFIDVSTTNGGVTETSHTGHLALWNVSSGTLQSTLAGVEPFAFSSDGHTLVFAAAQNTNDLIIWDLTSGKQKQSLYSGGFFARGLKLVVFSPDGHALATNFNNGAVEIWDTSNWQVLRTLR